MLLRNKRQIGNIIEALAFAVILICVGVSIRMNVVGRTLWLDEAMLAISLNTRSFLELCATPLDWNQSAPVVYVYIIKIIISLFGNSEFVFRVFSIVCYAAVLVIFYVLVRRVIQTDFPMLWTAALANVAFLLEYSNMFKPYIFDALSVMLVLLFYYLYREEKIAFPVLCGVYFLLIWCSNPVAFYAGGVVAYECIHALLCREKRAFWRGVCLGVSICVSFIIMYFVWLKPTIATSNLSEFWEGYEMPLLIRSREVLEHALYLIKFVTQGIGPMWKMVLFLAVVALVVNVIWKRNAYIWALTIGMAINLLASNLGFFPMSDRMFLFIIPLLVFLAVFMIKWLVELVVKETYQKWVVVFLAAVLLLSGEGVKKYHSGEAYIPGEEANESIAYIQEHLTKDDLIYVYYPAIPVFMYKMGYDNLSVGGFENNVYYGHGFFCKDGGSPEDIEYISRQKGIYVLFSHVVDYEPTDNLMNVLNAQGTLEKMIDPYLYYYSCDGSQSKANVRMELLSAETSADDICTVRLRIINNGDTHLNNGMENFYVHSMGKDISYAGEESVWVEDILPGESTEVEMRFAWSGDEEVKLSLFNQGKYDMTVAGMEPVTVQK